MNQYITSIIAGCATQGLISTFLWHRGLLGLPARVERIESDLSDIKAELREMRSMILRLNERIDKLIDKS